MTQRQTMSFFALLFAAACAAALLTFRGGFRGELPEARPAPPALPQVAWRVPLGTQAGAPCACADGWGVADAAGGVTKVSLAGRVQWRASFSNEVFAGAVEVAGGGLAVASESGRVYGLSGATGAPVWRRETGARFQHAPLAGLRGDEPVVWLVSQEDGRLFCLRASDGSVVWTAEATNRCDGEPVAWPGRIAYGNCDGAVYLFDALDGACVGKVEVGEGDQMAGGMLMLDDGLLATGTRSGKLVLVNPATGACDGSVQVSESEAFVTPVACAGRQIAMGSQEGDVTLWLREGKALRLARRVAAGAEVKSLVALKERVCALAGGRLCVFDVRDGAGEVGTLPLGDEVGPLALNASNDLACVADGALVCVKGGGE